ncbi:hypothetical protein HG530_008571 [Fusarium avenaceum]|nr:hypothetical protein HG530_008571 [Fusarium avenaceum]
MFVIIRLHLTALLQSPIRNAQHVATLKHKRHAPLPNLERLQLSIRRPLKSISIRSMRRHDIMQTGPSWLETTARFGVVLAADQTHEFRHGVAVVPRGTECIFLDEPAWWEDDEICDGGAWMVRGAGQDGED